MARNEARIRITAVDNTAAAIGKAQRGIRNLSGVVAGASKRMLGLAAAVGAVAGAASLTQVGKDVILFNDRVGKLSDRLDQPVEQLSALAFAADLAGIQFASFSKITQNMMAGVEEARDGMGTASRAFKTLRLDATEFAKLDLVSQFGVMADAFTRLADAEQEVLTAEELFGGRGVEALQMMRNGAEGLAMALEDARVSGAIINDEQARQAAALVDSVTRVSAGIRRAATGAVDLAAGVIGAKDATSEMSVDVEQMAATWKALRGAISSVFVPDAAKTAATETQREMERAADNVQGTLSGAILSGARDGSKGFAETLANALQFSLADRIAKLVVDAAAGTAIGGFFGGLLGFNTGGVVPGPRGAPRLAVVHGGETVLPTHRNSMSGGLTLNVPVHIEGGGDVERKIVRGMEIAKTAAVQEVRQLRQAGRL